MKIIVVSYKPESIDYCMGNVMEHYNSDHIVGKFDNIKEAALQIANCKAKKLGHMVLLLDLILLQSKKIRSRRRTI